MPAGWAAVGLTGLQMAGVGQDKPEEFNPWEIGQADLEINNPDRANYFGNVQLVKDPGQQLTGRGAREDDTYTLEQNLSPEMQQIAQALLGRAGASRGTFDSGGMSQGFMDKFEGATGYAPSVASYDRPEFAFGVGNEALAVPEPGGEGSGGIDAMSNYDAFQWAKDNTNLSQPAVSFLEQLFAESPGLSDNSRFVDGTWNPQTSSLTPTNQGYVQEFQSYITPQQDPALQQDPRGTDLGGFTNQDIIDWATNLGGGNRFSEEDAAWLDSYAGNNPDFADSSSFIDGTYDHQFNEGGDPRGVNRNDVFDTLTGLYTPYIPGVTTQPVGEQVIYDPTQPNPANWDETAMNGLIQAMETS